jgi:hypothetical protein
MTFVGIVTNGILLFCVYNISNYIPVDSPFEALQNDTTAKKLILRKDIEHRYTTSLDTKNTIIVPPIRSISIKITRLIFPNVIFLE